MTLCPIASSAEIVVSTVETTPVFVGVSFPACLWAETEPPDGPERTARRMGSGSAAIAPVTLRPYATLAYALLDVGSRFVITADVEVGLYASDTPTASAGVARTDAPAAITAVEHTNESVRRAPLLLSFITGSSFLQ
jgi:hypothetical protein